MPKRQRQRIPEEGEISEASDLEIVEEEDESDIEKNEDVIEESNLISLKKKKSVHQPAPPKITKPSSFYYSSALKRAVMMNVGWGMFFAFRDTLGIFFL